MFPPIPAATAQAHPSGAREEIGDMIEALRARRDMDVAFVSRQIGTTHRIFTHVAARGIAPLNSGDHNPNENSLCWLVIQGKLPERVTDTSLYEAAACLPITDAINVRAHFSVPLRRRDGRPACLCPLQLDQECRVHGGVDPSLWRGCRAAALAR
jgi:hypothetical protein